MSTTTTNYALVKIALTDSPPDITVINPNFDTIDTQLKAHADSLVNKVNVSGTKVLSDVNYTATEQSKLAGIATSANLYVHPTTDGNLHVPATGTTNNLKVLRAGATAGSFGWVTLTPDNLDDAATTHKFVAAADITKLGNLSGTNTGDQTLPTLISLGVTATAAELNKLDGATPTVAQLNFVAGVTSAIQTQLDAKTPFATLSAVTPATLGWYRIASSAVNIGANSGLFKVDFSGTGVKGSVLLRASCHDGVAVGTNITQLGFTSTNLALGLTKVRVVYHTTPTANYAYLEVYNPTALAITFAVDVIDSTGWVLTTPSTVGSIPSGYTSEELTLDSGLITNEDIIAGKQLKSLIATGTAPLTVASTTKVTNLNVDRLDDQEGTYYLSPANLSSAVPITKGGTGAITAPLALVALGVNATAAELNKLDGATLTVTELNYVDGVTSPIQTQLNGKQASLTESEFLCAGGNAIILTGYMPLPVPTSDPAGFYSAGAPTLLTIPAGVTKVTIYAFFYMKPAYNSSQMTIYLRKNGTNVLPFFIRHNEDNGAAAIMELVTPALTVTTNDTIQFYIDLKATGETANLNGMMVRYS